MTTLLASLALLVSVLSLAVSFSAHRLARRQEKRKQPLLTASLINAHVLFERKDHARVFGFLLSIINPSDSSNSISEITLNITYRSSRDIELTVQIPSSQQGVQRLSEGSTVSALTIATTRIGAHETHLGWAIFRVSEALLEGATIERYEIAIFDSHRTKATIEPVVIRELRP
jgi:hypothetical protein